MQWITLKSQCMSVCSLPVVVSQRHSSPALTSTLLLPVAQTLTWWFSSSTCLVCNISLRSILWHRVCGCVCVFPTQSTVHKTRQWNELWVKQHFLMLDTVNFKKVFFFFFITHPARHPLMAIRVYTLTFYSSVNLFEKCYSICQNHA